MTVEMISAITLWQPWATLIAIGVQTFETRSWSPPPHLIGKRIAIHAAKTTKTIDEIEEGWFPGDKEIRDVLNRHDLAFRHLPLGMVVCTTKLGGSYLVSSDTNDRQGFACIDARLTSSPLIDKYIPVDPFGDFSLGRWLWRLDDVKPLDPAVPARGKQGIWNWKYEEVA